MPGQLKVDAKCPECGEPLDGLIDTTNTQGVTREYFHSKNPESPKRRRRRPCKVHYNSILAAQLVRKGLEV